MKPSSRRNSTARAAAMVMLLVLAAAAWIGIHVNARNHARWIASAPMAELQQYLATHSDDAAALIRLGVLTRNAGDEAEAQKLLQRAVEAAPDNANAWIEQSRTISDDRDAVSRLENYLKGFPDSADVMAELAERYVRLGDAVNASRLIQSATRISPLCAAAWRANGDYLAAIGSRPEAETSYRKALSLQDDADTRLALARLWIPLQRYPEIIDICAPILVAQTPQSVSTGQHTRALFYTAAGRLYQPLTNGELQAVQAQLQEADRLSAGLSPQERFLPAYFLGESCLRMNQPKRAIPYLERSVQEGPMFAGSLYSLSRAYRMAGDNAKADAAMRRHIVLSRQLSAEEMKQDRSR